jgi:hypothetical protein
VFLQIGVDVPELCVELCQGEVYFHDYAVCSSIGFIKFIVLVFQQPS